MIVDRRLRPLVASIGQGAFSILSIDIFDTLLWRTVPQPRDIFCLVGDSLLKEGILAEWVSCTVFSELRVSAEKASRIKKENQSGSREVLLGDIYENLPQHIWVDGASITAAADIEVDIEARSLVLDSEISALMGHARAADVRVVLTSDTYFTRKQLIRFLTSAGLESSNIPETLFISNEHGRSKWLDLFDLVLTDLGIAPDKIVHLGDNIDADVVPCVLRGIAHVHYDKWSNLPRARSHEIKYRPADRAAWLLAGGDRGLTGLRSRLAQRAPENLDPGLESYWGYGATTLAPLFAAYGRWVLDTLRQEDAEVSFGIMREGRFLNKVIASVGASLGQKVESVDLWLSRRAVVRAALWDDDFSLLPDSISLCPGPKTNDILSQLGIARSDLAETAIDAEGFDLHEQGGVDALLEAVSRSPVLQSRIAAESRRQRRNLLKYLSREVDLGNLRKLFVLDIGYAGTIQTVLLKIFRRERVDTDLTGLYVAINEPGRENVRAGTDMRALFFSNGFSSEVVEVLERTPDVLEHACMCVEGSLNQFTDEGQPELLSSQRDGKQIQQMEAMQSGIIAGVEAITSLFGERTLVASEFIEHAGEIVRQALLRPTVEEAETIGRWVHEANFDLSDKRMFSDLRMDKATFEFGNANDFLGIQRHESYWPAAALMRIAPHLCEMTASLKDGAVTAGAFTSGAILGSLTITPDLGVGFDDKYKIIIPLSLSSLGRATLRQEIKSIGPETYQSIRIIWPEARAAVSIMSCEVTFRGEKEYKQVELKSQVTFLGSIYRENEIEILGSEGGQCEIYLGSVIPPWLHAIELRMMITYARLDSLF